MKDVLRMAEDKAVAAAVPLHVMALAPGVDPACGKFRGEDTAVEDAAAEQVAAQLRGVVALLPPGTTSEVVRGYGLAALKAHAQVGDVLITPAQKGLRAKLDSVLGRV
jgi:hypothetical protein